MSEVDPVDNRLEVDTEHTTNPTKAHPFQVQSDGGFFEGRVMTHRFRVRSEVVFALFTSHTNRPSTIET